MPDLLMLDPSLFMSRDSFKIVVEGLGNGELKNVRIPSSFASALTKRELTKTVSRFFSDSQKSLSSREIISGLRAGKVELPESYVNSSEWRKTKFETQLFEAVEDTIARQILMEEWDFLTSQSWIAAKTRKAYDAFLKGGAAALEWGGNKFDYLAAKTLKIPPSSIPDGLKPKQRLRAAAKWIAVGGASASVFLIPPAAFATTAITGYFCIFDP